MELMTASTPPPPTTSTQLRATPPLTEDAHRSAMRIHTIDKPASVHTPYHAMATDASSTRLASSPQRDHEEEEEVEEEEEEEEEDYMSLAFVSQPVTSSGNSARTQPLSRTKPKGSSAAAGARERELLARQKGLHRSLFAARSGEELQHEGDEVGSAKRESKAVRMMKGMGWSEGKSLGAASSGSALGQHMARGEATASRRSASPQPREATTRGTSEGQCGEAQSLELSASHRDAMLEPIRPDERWAGGSKGGIGSLSVLQSVKRISQAIKRAAEGSDVQGTSSQDFEASLRGYRDRVGGKQQALRLEKLMESARNTTEELDGRANVEYSPLWLDARWIWMPDAAPSEAQSVMEQAFGEAEGMKGDQGDGSDEQTTCVHQARLREAQRWAKLDTPARLQITLDHLRRAHNYCLFCGCAYDDFDQLQKLCPGLTEEDHD
ncbi:hypothetical protein IE81DRAFT_369509 [Ceraceosorus guamensis]|uniref:G-patch domain-containing protein n=1 Tax=Ceraceosorus guamensis TaxID=1522189 RepID=A0A316VMV2_9BASI|nr:hypothetical protein IE81DRAFT_369509 [Ceraceosorus guamensis]PWN38887.1 hypothetical protein IE81DRAFT_369509 [Ceraceosorus guamensis]